MHYPYNFDNIYKHTINFILLFYIQMTGRVVPIHALTEALVRQQELRTSVNVTQATLEPIVKQVRESKITYISLKG